VTSAQSGGLLTSQTLAVSRPPLLAATISRIFPANKIVFNNKKIKTGLLPYEIE